MRLTGGFGLQVAGVLGSGVAGVPSFGFPVSSFPSYGYQQTARAGFPYSRPHSLQYLAAGKVRYNVFPAGFFGCSGGNVPALTPLINTSPRHCAQTVGSHSSYWTGLGKVMLSVIFLSPSFALSAKRLSLLFPRPPRLSDGGRVLRSRRFFRIIIYTRVYAMNS